MSSLIDQESSPKVVFIPKAVAGPEVVAAPAPTPDNYANAANFAKSRFASISFG